MARCAVHTRTKKFNCRLPYSHGPYPAGEILSMERVLLIPPSHYPSPDVCRQTNTSTTTNTSTLEPKMSVQLPGPQGADGRSSCGVFRLLSLPAELTFHIASYLPTRSLISLLLTSPAFAHLASLMGVVSRQDYYTGIETLRVYTPLQFFCSRGIESVVRCLLLEGADPNYVHYVIPSANYRHSRTRSASTAPRSCPCSCSMGPT